MITVSVLLKLSDDQRSSWHVGIKDQGWADPMLLIFRSVGKIASVTFTFKVLQSERLDLYRSYAKKLLEVCSATHAMSFVLALNPITVQSGHAYRCFCSPDKLADTRERLARTGSNSTYDKTCLHLTDEEIARRVRAGEKSTVRLNVGVRSFSLKS